jgi:hypothetical protein
VVAGWVWVWWGYYVIWEKRRGGYFLLFLLFGGDLASFDIGAGEYDT